MSVAWRVTLVAVGALVIVLGLGFVALVRSEGLPTPAPTPTDLQVEETLFSFSIYSGSLVIQKFTL